MHFKLEAYLLSDAVPREAVARGDASLEFISILTTASPLVLSANLPPSEWGALSNEQR